MDEFVEPVKNARKNKLRGSLAKYTDPALAKKEKGAWERAAVEKLHIPKKGRY